MKMKTRFLVNYILVFFITSIIAILALILLSVVSGFIEDTLVKNQYDATSMMKDDYRDIQVQDVIYHNGGVQIIDEDYKIIFTEGINNFPRAQLTVSEFTHFLTSSQAISREYSYSIAYNEKEKFWLIITFPTSLRFDFAMTHNSNYASSDTVIVVGTIILGITVYLLLLASSSQIYSKIMARSFSIPMEKLQKSVNLIKEGRYEARVSLNLKHEFGDLEQAFNRMAETIEIEMALRKKSEHLRKQLILDIAHDLKNPLAVITGYTEYCIEHPSEDSRQYLVMIRRNAYRASALLTGLFELTKLDSPDFKLNLEPVDFSEFLRVKLAEYMDDFIFEGFDYEFDIPTHAIKVPLDTNEIERAIDNLINNALKYNDKGTKIHIELKEDEENAYLLISDNGIGIPDDLQEDIFKPFVKVDASRQSGVEGSGLGLAITMKIIQLHNGTITMESKHHIGSIFSIALPKTTPKPSMVVG
ncbi:MAG: hypothetical protein CVU95_11960 [Firmicutes bacterium HGW-Firmicutes-2]|jgi:signal transduction histidine kinase|nr:MAG: hypothetical protein CVU95_11960 [Firmicutes bacterium HGW-Firmicutes-2]